jgi:hypothetical protein
MDLIEMGLLKDMDRIHLKDDRGRWRALVNIVMNLLVSQKTGLS